MTLQLDTYLFVRNSLFVTYSG